MTVAVKNPKRAAAAKPAARPAAAPEPKNQRDLTKQETREALLRAGTEMFAEQGLDVPSLDALCARAGFTRGAFYVHFRDREDFIVAVMEAATSTFLGAIMSVRGEALDLGQIVGAFAASMGGGQFPVFGKVPLHQFLTACARSPLLRKRYTAIVKETIARLAETIRAQQKAGTARKDLDPELLGGLLITVALVVGAVNEIDRDFNTPAHARALLGMLSGS